MAPASEMCGARPAFLFASRLRPSDLPGCVARSEDRTSPGPVLTERRPHWPHPTGRRRNMQEPQSLGGPPPSDEAAVPAPRPPGDDASAVGLTTGTITGTTATMATTAMTATTIEDAAPADSA